MINMYSTIESTFVFKLKSDVSEVFPPLSILLDGGHDDVGASFREDSTIQ